MSEKEPLSLPVWIEGLWNEDGKVHIHLSISLPVVDYEGADQIRKIEEEMYKLHLGEAELRQKVNE